MEGHLGGHGHFLTEFEQPIQDDEANAARSLAHRIRPFILRRLKEDVARDLPEKITMKHWCHLTDEQKALYGQIQDRYVAPVRASLLKGEHVNVATSIFPVLTKLKQVCDHPALISENKTPLLGRSEKFDFIAETIERAVQEGESIVLFSHFLGALDLFEALLREKGIRYVRIDGSTRNRQALIDTFNASRGAVALCSLMAAGHGINLTSASHVIHVDRWWNPAIEDQATDRVHRIGQTKTVYVYKVLTEGTLEEKIDALLAKKRGISDRVIGAATGSVVSWTRDELLDVLKPIRG
jgi:SNF2 family DNA or RNA helicase